MKRIFSRVLAVLLASCMAVSCASTGASSSTSTATSSTSTNTEVETLSVVTTIFPIYDWTREILGEDLENVELVYLEDNGIDVHSYEPTVDDMVLMTNCDLFIYVGGESDTWVDAVLANAQNPDMVVINLVDVLGEDVMVEAEVEGMQEHDHDHDDEEVVEDDHDHDEEEAEVDEHVWLSLRNAAIICRVIADELAAVNPAQADLYAANVADYLAQLSDLDAAYQAVVDEANQTTLLFADRFPFLYMMEDYGLSYYAAFSGCSSETEATFETIAFLAGKIDELGLTIVLTTETPAATVAETVIDSTTDKDMTILALNSMQAVTASQVEDGTTYLSVMESNLEAIAAAVK